MTSGISDRTSPDSINDETTPVNAIGGWLFRHRTAIPIPFALALLLVRTRQAPFSWTLVGAGAILTAAGEAVRLWGVHHIGVISRTRSGRLGPLIDSGPFALVRNPLYVGNIALWVGFAATARLLWLAPIVALLLALEYHAIVRWEERLLESRFGASYREYAARVPRWVPALGRANRTALRIESSTEASRFSWRETFFSERGTLIAIALGYALLWTKARF